MNLDTVDNYGLAARPLIAMLDNRWNILRLASLFAFVLFALLTPGVSTAAPITSVTHSELVQPFQAFQPNYLASQQAPDACSNYTYVTTSGSISPGLTDIGNHCDDCETQLTLPFSFTLYDVPSSTVSAGSNGIRTLGGGNLASNSCLPDQSISHAILPYWDDLRTDCQNCGIFVSTTGSPPSRIYNIEWRTEYASGTGTANFEVQLMEGSTEFAIIIGQTAEAGAGATIGVQESPTGCYTEYKCNSGGLASGLVITFQSLSNPTPTPTDTPLPVPSSTHTAISTPGGPTVTSTSGIPTATSTPCTSSFTDVPPSHWAYTYISWVACQGIAVGYSDGTFHPENMVTRGQIAKMVVLAAQFPLVLPPGAPHFSDVPPTYPFYTYIEVAFDHGVAAGYSDGTFRAGNLVTRPQIAKMVVLATGYPLVSPPSPTFNDVPLSYPFYTYIETATAHNVVSGYPCGGVGEPCPGRYFRIGNNASRGQLCKMLYAAFANP
jgi:hypothetical protein